MRVLHEGKFMLKEVNCVGAGICRGFANTKEVHMMNYKQA
jgi:hypothetical protein